MKRRIGRKRGWDLLVSCDSEEAGRRGRRGEVPSCYKGDEDGETKEVEKEEEGDERVLLIVKGQ